MLVVNAACKDADYAHMSARLPDGVSLEPVEDRALIALQGPTPQLRSCPNGALRRTNSGS